ncbi:Leucine rich repeat [Popillia japonica]|uniref:Leucine rich repeat n=1 Tax=Popillia japonica TaxID=7064 RepID=A0AAW1JI40_POPJA
MSYRTLSDLKVLNLSANGAHIIKDGYFARLSDLKRLDLSNNNLSILNDKILLPQSNLQYLNLSNNRLEVLNEACFSSLLRLQQLDGSWNRLAKVVPGNLKLPSLARLLLARNSRLDFASNELEQIEDDALGRLDSLTVLYLTDNELSNRPKSLPEKLKVFHLERNRIKIIQSNDFQNLNQLETLLLCDNKIATIQENAFNYLFSILSLDLSEEPTRNFIAWNADDIRSQQPEATFPLTSTEYLIILGLSKSPGLAHQLLQDSAALIAARELQELNLADTDIEYVRSDILHYQELNLADTDIEYVRSDILHYLPQLRLLHLQGNPLNCTNLYWQAVWMRKQDEDVHAKVTCASPAEFWSIPLVDLHTKAKTQPPLPVN